MAQITLEQIRVNCGYKDLNAMRLTWYALFGKENGFPDKESELPVDQAMIYLKRISSPYPNKPGTVVNGALQLLEGLQSGRIPEITEKPQAYEVKPAIRNRTPATPSRVTQEQPAKSREKIEAETRAKIILDKEREDRERRERHYAEEAAEEKRREEINARLSPWIVGLTWTLNGLEMVFLIVGFYLNAGGMGLIAGTFIAVLGAIVLLQVQVSGSAASYAVFAWFVVCSLGGWLIEFPAMLQAIQQSGTIISEDGETYAYISVEFYSLLVTILISGSSFAGTYFRYEKAKA